MRRSRGAVGRAAPRPGGRGGGCAAGWKRCCGARPAASWRESSCCCSAPAASGKKFVWEAARDYGLKVGGALSPGGRGEGGAGGVGLGAGPMQERSSLGFPGRASA